MVPPASDAADSLLEAWREALAEVLDTERREWTRERALIEAQAASVVSALKADVVALRSEIVDRVNARLAELKNGDPGAPGDHGDPGPAGPAGPQGEPGLPGIGTEGPAGPAGPPGEPGTPGERGPEGPIGPTGEAGEQGSAGEPGNVGERGAEGPVGPEGPQGPLGEAGPAGPAGEPGAPGENGKDGKEGEPGAQGKAGPQGLRGERGERGEAGLAGINGKDGAPGELREVKPYVEGSVHYHGDLVLHDGSTYQAKADTARPPPHESWGLIASRGVDASQMQLRGTYKDGETYRYLDVVALNGSSFVARTNNPGTCPGAGWKLLASAGRPGKPGPKGEHGERGPAGERGQSGKDAPVILSWQIDRKTFRATPLMSDDSEGPSLDLRGLFEQFQMETR
jgi:hypothetical protein